MKIADLIVDNQTAKAENVSIVPSGTVGATITLSLSHEWDDLTPTVVFIGGEVERDIVNATSTVSVPPEVLKEPYVKLVVGVQGHNADGTLVLPTNYVTIYNKIQDGTEINGRPPEVVSPDWTEQIETLVNNKLDKEPIEMKTTADTQPVHRDSDGKLWTMPGGGGSGGGTTDYNALDNRPSINGHTLVTGMTSTELGIKDGKDGRDGENGTPGTDGVSPTTVLSPITGGTRLVITDAAGEHSADILNGKDGEQLSFGLKGKKLSILGDSISTFSGSIPKGYDTFYPRADVTSVELTWWSLLLKKTGMTMLKNCSWSGSCVSNVRDVFDNSRAICGCSNKRISDLSESGTNPDIVLVFIGINDFSSGAKIRGWDGSEEMTDEVVQAHAKDNDGKFYFDDAYALMLTKIIKRYPKAEVICSTIMESAEAGYDATNLVKFNDAVRMVASAMSCKVIDIHSCGINVYNKNIYLIDKWHPNKIGSEKLSRNMITGIMTHSEYAYADAGEIIPDPDKPMDIGLIGKMEVGNTVEIVTTSNGIPVDNVLLSVTSGSDLVTLSGNKMQLKQKGNVQIKAEKAGYKTSFADFVISENEPPIDDNLYKHPMPYTINGSTGFYTDSGVWSPNTKATSVGIIPVASGHKYSISGLSINYWIHLIKQGTWFKQYSTAKNVKEIDITDIGVDGIVIGGTGTINAYANCTVKEKV